MIPDDKPSCKSASNTSNVSEALRSIPDKFESGFEQTFARKREISGFEENPRINRETSSSRDKEQGNMKQFIIRGTMKKSDPQKTYDYLDDDAFETSHSQLSQLNSNLPYVNRNPSEYTENSRLEEMLSAATHVRNKSQETIEIFENFLVYDKSRTIEQVGENLSAKLMVLKKNVAGAVLQNLQLIDQLLEAEKSMRQVRSIYETIHDAYSRPRTFSCSDDFSLESLAGSEYLQGRSKCESLYEPRMPDFDDVVLKRYVVSRKRSIRKRFVSRSLRDYVIEESLTRDEGLCQLAVEDCCPEEEPPSDDVTTHLSGSGDECSDKEETKRCKMDANSNLSLKPSTSIPTTSQSLSRDDDGYVSGTNMDQSMSQEQPSELWTRSAESPENRTFADGESGETAMRFVATCSSRMVLRSEGNKIIGIFTDVEDDDEDAQMQSSYLDQESTTSHAKLHESDSFPTREEKSGICFKHLNQPAHSQSMDTAQIKSEDASTSLEPSDSCFHHSSILRKDMLGENPSSADTEKSRTSSRTTNRIEIGMQSLPRKFVFGSRHASSEFVTLSTMKQNRQSSESFSDRHSKDTVGDDKKPIATIVASKCKSLGIAGLGERNSQIQKKVAEFLQAAGGDGRKPSPRRR